MNKPIVDVQDGVNLKVNDLITRIFDRREMRRYQGKYFDTDLLMSMPGENGAASALDNARTVIGITWEIPIFADFLWWINVTKHNKTAQTVLDDIRTSFQSHKTSSYASALETYKKVFNGKSPYTTAHTTPIVLNPIVANALPSAVGGLFIEFRGTHASYHNIAGPYELVNTLTKSRQYPRTLNIVLSSDNISFTAIYYNIAEYEFAKSIGSDVVVANLKAYEATPNFDWNMNTPLNAQNEGAYMTFTNSRIAHHFGLPRNYHKLNRDFTPLLHQALANRNVLRFANLDVLDRPNPNQFIVGYGIVGRWFPVNLSTTKSPYFYMPNVGKGRYMDQTDVANLINLLQDTSTIPSVPDIRDSRLATRDSLLFSLSRYNRNIQEISISMYNLGVTNQADAAPLFKLLVWAMTYKFVARGLQKDGTFRQDNKEVRTERAQRQIAIYNSLHEQLSENGKQFLNEIPLLDTNGNILPKLPIGIEHFGPLAAAENVCWGYKGEKMYGTPYCILLGLYGKGLNAEILKYLTRADTELTRGDPELYPLAANVAISFVE